MDPRRIKLIDQVNFTRDKKQQVYTFSVLTFIVIIVLAVGAVKPSLETIVRLRAEIEQKRTIQEQLETKLNTLNQLEIQYSEFEDTVKDLVLIYPANGDFSLFLANIEFLAEDGGFELVSIGFDPTTRSRRQSENLDALDPLEVQLSVYGKSTNLVSFMKRLESTPMYAEIENLSFSIDEKNPDVEERTYSIQMLIYGIQDTEFYNFRELPQK